MAHHHDAFKSLGPVEWDDIPQDDLKTFLDGIFQESLTIVDSVPKDSNLKPSNHSSDSVVPNSSVSASASTPALIRQPSPTSLEHATKLEKEWKEAKVNAKDNPMGIRVYKLSSKDGKGAWFARKSVHEGLSFDTWKEGLEKEFGETMKVEGPPGSGNIRGIGADRRVAHEVIEKCGQLDVFQLSAQFPGPTSPRDFITLLLTSDHSHKASDDTTPSRQYVVVSKPCRHPDCPPRSGIIRGQYESIEIIREIPGNAPTAKDTQSTPNLVSDSNEHGGDHNEAGHPSPRIEWIMVTRSDPGGSVPRFMIEKGTPPGIVGDAGKFVKWISSGAAGEKEKKTNSADGAPRLPAKEGASTAIENHATSEGRSAVRSAPDEHEEINDPEYSSSLYSMITGALGMASSVVASGIRKQWSGYGDELASDSSGGTPTRDGKDGDSLATPSDTSSVRSFASAIDKSPHEEQAQQSNESLDRNSEETKSQSATQHEKELRRLQEKREKLDEKVSKMQERMEQKREEDKEKDAAALAKAREKHEREIAKHEAKYMKELRKLEEKREQEIRKSEEKKRKAIEKEEKQHLLLEIDRIAAERDESRQAAKVLQEQVRDLQARNAEMAAKLGRSRSIGSVSKSSSDLSRRQSAGSRLSQRE